ncbi:MAG: hypothetical protein AAFQ98_08235 [Bacteroidota bacterium]
MKKLQDFEPTELNLKGMSKTAGGYGYTWWEWVGTGNMGSDGNEIKKKVFLQEPD